MMDVLEIHRDGVLSVSGFSFFWMKLKVAASGRLGLPNLLILPLST